MAYAPLADCQQYRNGPKFVLGQFREAECGNTFEYSRCRDGEEPVWAEYPQKVWVTTPSEGLDQGFRWAKVLKTVAYIVVDEEADGSPIIEKWLLRGHREYGRA